VNILIITGGNSSERKVSLGSAKNVKEALQKKGYKVKLFDLRQGFDFLNNIVSEFEILFPVLHGEDGEGGRLHKYLTKFEKPIVGTRNYKALRKAWYKIQFKQFCENNGILTSPWKKVRLKKEILEFGFPSVLKSSSGGSSREVVILKDKKDLNSYAARKLLNSGLELFVEKYLPGVEVTAGILEGKALSLIEIVPPKGSWFDYKNKYSGVTQEIPHAPSLTEKLRKEVGAIAEKIHNTLDLGSYSRIDFMVSDNLPYAIEVNTIPGLTSESLLPKAARATGISFGDFLQILVKNSLR